MLSNNFAKAITNLIENNSLNQLSFANAVNVNQSQVSDWISGKSKKRSRRKAQSILEPRGSHGGGISGRSGDAECVSGVCATLKKKEV